MKWRILVHPKLPSAENMAIDEAILIGNIDGTSQPTVRFYDWEPATVSCGYNQKVKEEIDLKLLKKYSLGFVRRPTGGRVVLHHDEVTYSVIAPNTDKFAGGLMQIYSAISFALKNGLNQLGIPVDFEKGNLSSEEQRKIKNPCFTSSSKFELSYNKRKIVGSAQLRKDKAFLQHGSILRNNDQSFLANLIPGLQEDERIRFSKFLAKRTISPKDYFNKKIEFNDMVQVLIKGFKDEWKDDVFEVTDQICDNEKNLVIKLIKEKYSKNEWNFKFG